MDEASPQGLRAHSVGTGPAGGLFHHRPSQDRSRRSAPVGSDRRTTGRLAASRIDADGSFHPFCPRGCVESAGTASAWFEPSLRTVVSSGTPALPDLLCRTRGGGQGVGPGADRRGHSTGHPDGPAGDRQDPAGGGSCPPPGGGRHLRGRYHLRPAGGAGAPAPAAPGDRPGHRARGSVCPRVGDQAGTRTRRGAQAADPGQLRTPGRWRPGGGRPAAVSARPDSLGDQPGRSPGGRGDPPSGSFAADSRFGKPPCRTRAGRVRSHPAIRNRAPGVSCADSGSIRKTQRP